MQKNVSEQCWVTGPSVFHLLVDRLFFPTISFFLPTPPSASHLLRRALCSSNGEKLRLVFSVVCNNDLILNKHMHPAFIWVILWIPRANLRRASQMCRIGCPCLFTSVYPDEATTSWPQTQTRTDATVIMMNGRQKTRHHFLSAW